MARQALHACAMMVVMMGWCAAGETAPAQERADAVETESYEQRLEALEADVKALSQRVPAWINNISFKGDFRYRYEMIDQDDDGNEVQHRNRIRARFGLYAKVNEHVDAAVALSTGGDDPVSGNLTLGDSFRRDEFRLDRAYVNLHPTFAPHLDVWGGKIPNPFFAPGKSELLWDHDLNPEGGAVTYKLSAGDIDFFTNLGGFWVVENGKDRSIDAGLFGAQGGAKANLMSKKAYLLAGAGYFDYTNPRGKAMFYGAPRGNTAVVNAYVYDYDELEAFAEAGAVIGGIDVAVFGDYAVNTAIGGGDKTGWLAGIAVGKLKNQWDWALRYNYRRLEGDAVIAAFTDSDFKGGGTDGKGHEVGADLMVLKNFTAGVTYFDNQSAVDHGKDHHRVQVDLAVKF